MQTRCQVLACHGTLDAPLGVHAMEIQVDHRCALESVTERIARVTNAGGAREEARRALDELLADRDFDRCCVPHYLAPAPRARERELEIPVAEAGRIRTRVIVWPVGAKDVRHPHTDGWAAFSVVRGDLTVTEERRGARRPERRVPTRLAQVLRPEDGVAHHMHNRGGEVGLTIHVFGQP